MPGYNSAVARINPAGGGSGRAGSVRRGGAGGRGAKPVRPSQAELGELVQAIDNAGAALKRDPGGSMLERYREAVREFMDAALADAMQVSTENLGLRQRIFSTITKVDIALADLADAVLGRQHDVLTIGSQIEQIKGLIVDLYK
jgi:uncharacterized protein YaaR (DUF327 family)